MIENEINDSNYIKVGDFDVDLKLNKVFDSEGEPIQFSNLTLRLFKILIEKSPQEVSQDEIKAYVWGGTHITDETLQQRIRLLRKALNDNPANPQYIETVRSQGYRLIAPVTIQQKKNKIVQTKVKSIPKLLTVSTVLIMIFAALFLWYSNDQLVPVETEIDSKEFDKVESKALKIAIIPFKAKYNHDTSTILADGLTNQLTLTLSYINELFLIDQVTINYYTTLEKSPFQIGEELELDAFIVGEVERQGSKIKIEVMMFDVQSERLVWSKMFDADFEEILHIQTQIIKEITQSLHVSLKPAVQNMVARPTRSASAYDYFLQAQKYLSHLQKDDNQIAIELSKKALEIDPDYADAHILLGYGYLFKHGHWNASPDFIELAIEQANKAISIAPNSSHAYYLLGLAYHYKSSVAPGNWIEKTREAYKTSLALNPNNLSVKSALAGLYYDDQKLDETLTILYETLLYNPKSTLTHLRIGTIFEDLNYNDVALEWYEKALEIKPDYYRAMMQLSQLHQALGHHDQALYYVDRILVRYPDKMDELFQKGDIYFDMEEIAMAEETYLKAIQNVPEKFKLEDGYYITSYIYLASIYQQTDRTAEFNQLLSQIEAVIKKEMKAFPEAVWNMVNMSLISILQHNEDQALYWLNKAVDNGFISDDWLKTDVLYRPLRLKGQLDSVINRINQATIQQRQQLERLNLLPKLEFNNNYKSL